MAIGEKLRIALVIEQMDPARGGRETSTAQIACALARRGHEVTVLCRGGALDVPGVCIDPVGARGWGRSGRLGNFVADVREAIRLGRFDIVHAMLPVPGADVYQLRGGTVPAQRAAGRRRRGPLAGLVAGLCEPLNLHRARMAKLEAQVVADRRVLCLPVSRMVARELADYYGRAEAVRVVYNGVEVPAADSALRSRWRERRRAELGIGAEAVVFLTVANNFRLKGVPEAISALARWWRRWRGGHQPGVDVHLVVAGGGDLQLAERWAGIHGVADKVHVVGHVRDIFTWYAAADAVVLLSWYDPCSRVVLEATRWGVPSITTRFNGAAEVLAGGAGLVVGSPRDVDAVAAAMDTLTDPRRREACSAACAQLADGLSIERHVEGLLAAYAELLER